MSRMRRLKWRRVVELVDEVWGTGGAVRREALGVRQKLWVGMQGEVGEDSDSRDVGCTEPLRYGVEELDVCCRCKNSSSLFDLDIGIVKTVSQ